MTKILDENFDRAAYRSALTASAGSDAVAEIERLGGKADVKTYIALYRPAQLAKVVASILEQFDRYVLIGRIKLDPVSPIARGEDDVDNPTEATEAVVQKFVDEHPSPPMDRYLDLADAMDAARRRGFNPPAGLKIGPMAYFAGAEGDLAELCIGRR